MNMSLKQAVLFFAIALILVMPIASTYAAVSAPVRIVPQCGTLNVCGLCDLVTLINNVIQGIIYLSVFLAACLFAYAGVKYLTAYGSDNKIKEAHKIFLNVAIGLVIILSAWLIINAIMSTLAGTSFTGWTKIC